jgi:hypothetical protein
MAGESHHIVFVHLGRELPRWSMDSLAQATVFNGCPVLLLANAQALQGVRLPAGVRGIAIEEVGLSDEHRAFRELSPLDSSFRDGFWTYTTERFFALSSLLQAQGLEHVVHLENDVLLYAELDTLVPKLARNYPGMAATFDNDHRCIPGFLYISEPAVLADMVSFVLSVLDHARSRPEHERAGLNDMLLLAAWRAHYPDDMGVLPIVPSDYPAQLRSAMGGVAADPAQYSRHFDELGMIFDAAALGQYLGGVDPRNNPQPSRGFINESCLFDPRRLRPRMETGADGLRRPVIETASGVWPVANLHMHCKDMRDFRSRP